jgi:tetratricopeptide (TPR) repeat protein
MVNAAQAMTAGTQSKIWTSAHALALLSAGDRPGAEEVLDRPAELTRNYFWLAALQARADVAADLQRRDHCQTLFDEMFEYSGRIGLTGAGSVCFGLVSRSLGNLALALDDVDAAVDLLTDAVAQADRNGMVFETVICRRLLATALTRTGDIERVPALVDEALSVAEQRGFAKEADLLRSLR